jgi:glycosyltransferase involved in cell wall biosynthesis
MPRISCVICAYNEADRIQSILNAVLGHSVLSEIIVVNDGSTDATESILREYKGIRIISYPKNKGKTFALAEGISAATGELVMLLDADLIGITPENISARASPVLSGEADVSMSMRRNSLFWYRLIGIDFVSGERVLPRSLLVGASEAMQQLPRWGGEVFINEQIVKQRLRLSVVRWQNVYNVRKSAKVGFVRGMIEDTRMIYDAFHVLPLWKTLVQIFALLLCKVARKRTAPALATVSIE